MATVKTGPALDSPTVDTNVGEDVKKQRESQRESKIINDALRDTGKTVDPKTQAIPDRAGFVNATVDWRDYMSNYLANNTEDLVKNYKPKFSIKDNTIKISGTKNALNSAIAKDAKKALSSALTGVDLSTDVAKDVVDELNKSIDSSMRNYIATEVYGFEDQNDYNNYLLAMQESQKTNPTSSTYFFTARDKSGKLVKKTFQDWMDYWRNEYSTDERADLFVKSANAKYGYDRIPYVLMSGGGLKGNARYGFDLGEKLGLGLYNVGAQLSKLPHGLVQQGQTNLSGLKEVATLLSGLDLPDGITAQSLVINAPQVDKETFEKIKKKLSAPVSFDGRGPVKQGVNNLNDKEKAVLALGVKNFSVSGVAPSEEQLTAMLAEADYETYKDRAKTAKEVSDREAKMSGVESRIANNMAVYGGSTNYFISNMVGVMLRQAEEAFITSALTGGKVNPNQIGERFGDFLAENFGVNAAGQSTILGTAVGKSVAQFIGGIPEDIIQDVYDAKLTNDPTLSEGVLSLENIGTNLVYRLAFNGIVKGAKNVIKNARFLRSLEKAARDAGYDMDADDLKRGISEAYTAFQDNRQVGVDDQGRVIFEDENGNLKTLNNVTVWSVQPLADIDVQNVFDQRVKDNVESITEEWKKKQQITVDDISPIKEYVLNGDYVVENTGKDVDIEVPERLKVTMVDTSLSPEAQKGVDHAIIDSLAKWGLDEKTIGSGIGATGLEAAARSVNNLFGEKYDAGGLKGGAVSETIAKVVELLDRDADNKIPEASKAKIADELKNKIAQLVGRGVVKSDTDLSEKSTRIRDVVFGTYSNGTPELKYWLNRIGENPKLLDQHSATSIALLTSDYPSLSVRNYIESEILTPVIGEIAQSYAKAIDNLSYDSLVEFTTMGIDAIQKALATADDADKAVFKMNLDETVRILDDLEYQKNNNQLFTPLPDHVLNDIHSANELGVAFNEQKIALMNEAYNTTPADFVFTRLQSDEAIALGYQTKGDFDKLFDSIMAGDIPEGLDAARVQQFYNDARGLYVQVQNAKSKTGVLLSGGVSFDLPKDKQDAAELIAQLNKLEDDFLNDTGLRRTVSKEGFTQNELLEIWTEAQYRHMTPQEMVKNMEEFDFLGEASGKNIIANDPLAVGRAVEYIYSLDQRPAKFWYEVSSQNKRQDMDEWLVELQNSNNPAIYTYEDGTTKVSGRSILELHVLEDKKLWAATAVKLKSDIEGEVGYSALQVANKIEKGTGVSDVHWKRAVMSAYDPSLTPEEATNEISKALLLETGMPIELADLWEDYSGKSKKTNTPEIDAAFVQWLAEKYSMGSTLYMFKEGIRAREQTMEEFLNTPITVSRVEKVWGPGRTVYVSGEYRAPSMDLSKETCLGFGRDLSGSSYGNHDPGHITMKVRPIDMIGDVGSPFSSGEKEVLIRKSIAYPAGTKMHTIFADGAISTYAHQVIGDKNARMFQVDESLVLNEYDIEKLGMVFHALDAAKQWKWTDPETGQVILADDLKGTVLGDYINDPAAAAEKYSSKNSPMKGSAANVIKALNDSVYGPELARMLASNNPIVKSAINKLMGIYRSASFDFKIYEPESAPILAKLLSKPFVIISTTGKSNVIHVEGISPDLDVEFRTNGGTHLNDPQARRTADSEQVLADWKEKINSTPIAEQKLFFDNNAGIMVDGDMVSFASLLDTAEANARLQNAKARAESASTKITMDNLMEGGPEKAPSPDAWGTQKTYKFKSYADALANRPSYKDANNVDAWMPAAVEVGMREFTDWRDNSFLKNHPDIDTAQLVETWDFVNFLVHKQEDYDAVNLDEILGKTFIDSGGQEVKVTQETIDAYAEFDTFIRQQGARIAALNARGFEDDYNQLGYLPHTDYNPMEQSAEEMIQGALWKENKLKNSTLEDGTFTTQKLDNNWENRYRTWISNMSYDSLGDTVLFSEMMKELIADGALKTDGTTTDTFTDKDGNSVKPQETIAKAMSGDKELNAKAAKAKSSKDFMAASTNINNKTDFKAIETQTAADAQKMGYSKALHDNYGDMYGNGRAKVISQKNVAVSKVTSLYDFMRNTITTDGSLLNHGGEMLINPNGMAKRIIREYRQTGNLKEIVVALLQEKSGRSARGAEYIFNKWLPEIQKHVSADGTINSAELGAVLTKKLRSEAWSSIKKWLARADYDQFNVATKKTLDNLLYRHNMIAQVSNNPGVMKTINKAMNAITGVRHRALFYLNPKNALLQLSECIRLFTEFKMGDAKKALKRLVTDADFRETVAEWKDIVFPNREPLENVEPMADAWHKTASGAVLKEDGTLDIKNTIKGGIQEADAVAMAPINAAEDMKNTVLIAGIVQELETKKANGTLKETDYDFVMRRFQRIALANDEFGRLGYSDNPFARATLYLQNFSIRQLKMFGDNVVDSWGAGGLGKATGYIMKTFGWRIGLFLIMAKLGYSAGQVLGYDPFDLIGEDYTGLDEEDETELDRQISSGALSPLFVGGLTSLIASYYFAGRQAYERTNEATPEDVAASQVDGDEDWGWKLPETNWGELLYQWMPGGGAARRTIQMTDLLDTGTAISTKGTKMYEAPSDLGNVIAGYMFGRNNTANARAYYQTPDPLQGFIDNGPAGLAQQMGRAFSTDFRQFDPIDKQNFSDWFDGSEADEQQWQSGYYYYRNRAKEIYDKYNGQYNGFNTSGDNNALKSSYREEMEELGEELNRFSRAYVNKHGALGGTKMQQLLNILNDAQTNMLMDEAEASQASLEGLNRAQERYAQAGLPAETRQTGPSTGSPDTRYQTRFSPQYYAAVQGVYGGSAEAAKILDNLYQTKWKDLRKKYSNMAYADNLSFDQRKKIQNEYINKVRQDLDGVVAAYGTSILSNDAVDDVLTDVFAGMVPYSDYNVNKYGRYVSLPKNVEVDVSDWLLKKYSGYNSNGSVSYNAETTALINRIKSLQNQGKVGEAKGVARLLLQRVQDQRASLTRSELEWLQGVLK